MINFKDKLICERVKYVPTRVMILVKSAVITKQWIDKFYNDLFKNI